MRDLSCYLSSLSLHTLAAALVTAGILEAPDFAVPQGGVSITGSQPDVAIETRFDFTDPPRPAASAANPFQIAPSDESTLVAATVEPAVPEVEVPAEPARPAASIRRRVSVEPLLIPHEGLREQTGPEPAQNETQKESRREVASTNPAKPAPAPESADIPEPKTNQSQSPRPTPEEPPKAETKTTAPKTKKPDVEVAKTTRPTRNPALAAPASNETSGAKVDQPPRKIATNPSPVYPRDAWRRQQEGVVYLLVRVSRDGRAENVKLYRSSGFRSLDMAAEKTVRGWRFRPASRAGQAVASPVVVPIRFQIQRP